MQHRREGRKLLVRLDRGEELVGRLGDLARDLGIGCASLAGIGAVEAVELGYYDLAGRTYERTQVNEICELLALTGNVALASGEPLVHAHAVLGRRDSTTLGGHLFAARVAVTAEVFLDVWSEPCQREMEGAVGLKLLRP